MNEAKVIDALRGISSATLHEAMDKEHTLNPDVRPLWRPISLCGPAFTVRARAGDNLAAHWALAVAPAGSVLVICYGNDAEHGGWGEIASVAAIERGLAGLVTDGAVRDTVACQELGFPIFSAGVSIRGTTKNDPGELNSPVSFAGTMIHPGDYIVGDEDGVVAVPRAQAEEIVERARERDRREAEIMRRLRQGELTVDLLGLRERLPGLE